MQEIGSICVGDGPKLMGGGIEAMTYAGLTPVAVTDPPFNIGYRYSGYTDRMDDGDYYAMLAEVTAQTVMLSSRAVGTLLPINALIVRFTATSAAAYTKKSSHSGTFSTVSAS